MKNNLVQNIGRTNLGYDNEATTSDEEKIADDWNIVTLNIT